MDEFPHRGQRPAIDLALSRRGFLRGTAGAVGLAGVGVFASQSRAVAVTVDAAAPRFLTDSELKFLSAVCDRVVPGQPEDVAVGAVQTGCPAAIDALLAAFGDDPPRIFAGAPYSDRGGSPVDYFAEFLPLDPYEERAWRLRVEGDTARGTDGFQQVYRRGLAALAKSSPLFPELPGPARDVELRTTGNADIQAMRDLAVTHTIEFFLAAPEYGGNQELGGWKAVAFEGDTQPRGFTDDEVNNPQTEPLPLLPASLNDLLGGLSGSLAGTLTTTISERIGTFPSGRPGDAARASAPALALGTAEGMATVGAAGTDYAAVQQTLGGLLAPLKDPDSAESQRLAQIHARAAQLVAEARK